MTEPPPKIIRCRWATTELNIPYHDEEWGVPVHDDHTWFEFLTLEGAQAGLSWDTVLKKRARYREVFANFDPKKVARYDAKKKKALLADPGIIRNRLKIDATITNARAFLKDAKGIRLVRQLHLAIRERQTKTKRLEDPPEVAGPHRRIRRPQQRPAKTRLPLRRLHNLLRPDASHRLGQRPRGRLLPVCDSRSRTPK